jgi:hypothetical protein
MLTWSCRRFRARFTPGTAHPHRTACRDCAAHASAVETAAGVRLPLPAGLSDSLRAIASPRSGAVLPFPVPRLPLPAATAARLRALAPARRPAPPEWVRSPRYAVAASAILALLLGPFLGPAADRGLRTLGSVRNELRDGLAPIAMQTEEKGLEGLKKLQSTAAAAESSARRATASVRDLSNRFSAFVHESLTRRN